MNPDVGGWTRTSDHLLEWSVVASYGSSSIVTFTTIWETFAQRATQVPWSTLGPFPCLKPSAAITAAVGSSCWKKPAKRPMCPRRSSCNFWVNWRAREVDLGPQWAALWAENALAQQSDPGSELDQLRNIPAGTPKATVLAARMVPERATRGPEQHKSRHKC